MKRFFHYFSMTQAERRGFVVLAVIVGFIILIPYIYGLFHPQEDMPYGLVYFESKSQDIIDVRGTYDDQHSKSSKVNTPVVYSAFDPNNLPVAEWKALGFSDRQIKVIKNYEAKGGQFHTKEDVAKIYSISQVDYDRIAPFIKIARSRAPTEIEYERGKYREYSEEAAVAKVDALSLDLNTSDTTAFKRLRGIGSVLSKRIVKYRESLGGFHRVEQVGEVYGVSEEVFQEIRKHLKVVPNTDVSGLAINQLSQDALARHPYISTKTAQLLVNYRNQHGNYTNIEGLKKIIALDSVFLRKIEPYLVF